MKMLDPSSHFLFKKQPSGILKNRKRENDHLGTLNYVHCDQGILFWHKDDNDKTINLLF